MLLGYNTNGLPHHRLLDAIDLLADLGYRSVAITLDAGALDPYEEPGPLARQVKLVRDRLDRHGLARVVETGARYLLNPRKKHDPTLLDPDPRRRAVRADFLLRAIDLAQALEAPVVSLWSGALPDPIPAEAALERLSTALQPVLTHAERTGCTLGFEPEPGFFIDRLEPFAALDQRIDHPLFQLTMDLGHVHCNEAGPIADHVRQWGRRLVNVHIEDMIRGVHDHRMFGEGTIDFPPVLQALTDVRYDGPVHVELSRHGHAGLEAAVRSMAFLGGLAQWA